MGKVLCSNTWKRMKNKLSGIFMIKYFCEQTEVLKITQKFYDLWVFFIENSFSRNRKCFTNAIVLQKLLKEIKKFNTQMLANEQTNECLSGESIKLGEWTKCFLREWKSFTNERKITKIQFFLPFLIFFKPSPCPINELNLIVQCN